jgi:hypothetical protein
MKCEVIERFDDFSLGFDAARMVRELLRCVPEADLAGLQSVVLTNEAAQSRKDRRSHTHARHKKYRLADCRGFYQQAWNGEAACIQLHMDRIFTPSEPQPNFRRRLAARCMAPISRRTKIAFVLFHEIGHHVQETKRRENGEPETLADTYMWKHFKRLLKCKWYLAGIGLLALLLCPLDTMRLIRSCS